MLKHYSCNENQNVVEFTLTFKLPKLKNGENFILVIGARLRYEPKLDPSMRVIIKIIVDYGFQGTI